MGMLTPLLFERLGICSQGDLSKDKLIDNNNKSGYESQRDCCWQKQKQKNFTLKRFWERFLNFESTKDEMLESVPDL